MKIDLVIVKKMSDLTCSVVSSLLLAIMDSYICYSWVALYEQWKIHTIFKVITSVLMYLLVVWDMTSYARRPESSESWWFARNWRLWRWRYYGRHNLLTVLQVYIKQKVQELSGNGLQCMKASKQTFFISCLCHWQSV